MLLDTMYKIKTAVILAGGAGNRINPYMGKKFEPDRPKPMIEVAGKPLLHWTLEKWLSAYNVQHVVFGVAYKKEFIIDYFTKNNLGMKIDFSEHSVEGETGEGFKKAISRFVEDDIFLAMNGDELTNLNISELVDFHVKSRGIATIVTAPHEVPYGVLVIDGNNTITGFHEKQVRYDLPISAGIYVFNKEILDYIPSTGSIEKITFNSLAQKRLLKAYQLPSNKKWYTVNNIKQLEIVRKEINNLWRN